MILSAKYLCIFITIYVIGVGSHSVWIRWLYEDLEVNPVVPRLELFTFNKEFWISYTMLGGSSQVNLGCAPIISQSVWKTIYFNVFGARGWLMNDKSVFAPILCLSICMVGAEGIHYICNEVSKEPILHKGI